jgi:hypothetical protein
MLDYGKNSGKLFVMQIIKFESDPPLTVFAPNWCWIMAEDTLTSDTQFLNRLKEIILLKELDTINSNKEKYNTYNEMHNIVYDGNTGLGENSLTSRAQFFNILNWDFNETTLLKQYIKVKYNEFLNTIGVEDRSVYIKCWANVLRDGQEIKQHIHASHPLTWLGGHITIACDNTSTFYVNPLMRAEGDQVYESKNAVGKITFFQNNIPHYTNTHTGNTERISIAFDIIPKERYDQYEQFVKDICIEL